MWHIDYSVRIDSPVFFIITLALFTIAALVGLWLRSWRKAHSEPEELSVTTLLGAALGLFGIMLGFTFYIANSRLEERRQLEVAEASDIQALWLRTSFLSEPARSTERFLIRQYLPLRIQLFPPDRADRAMRRLCVRALPCRPACGRWRMMRRQANEIRPLCSF